MKVLYLYANLQGSGHYRCIYPGRALERLGHRVRFTDRLETWSDTSLPLDLEHDLYVFQLSQDESTLRCMRALGEAGKARVYEIDDYYHAIPFYNPSSSSFRGRASERLAAMEECMREADAVTVATPELAERYSRFNPLTFPLPNCVDTGDPAWQVRREKRDGALVVGWAGSPTHAEDFRLVVGSLKRLCRRYPRVKVAVGGAADVYALLEGIPEEQKIFLPPVGFREYPAMLANFDIGLVPLADNEFNRCKSDLKGLEYSCLGIPVLASPRPSYLRLVKDGVNGFLCEGARDWLAKLTYLVENESARGEMGRRAREAAAARSVDRVAAFWEGVFTALVAEKRLRVSMTAGNN
ncbi:MAG: glycosyltransferase [Actinobacteria bacterium]|nr:glycosyltransferase [Actinomycetota bacterium]